ncbi:hypothetical protein BS50DRAFT_280770 [Corynespora cassiicola Philippines]|uniref:Uncharacterized protein n=1 Tax=Corynespora cassiicola Philippines TaxID=1448308 RepID=A0A2T2P153_CORCC|nr:hypothetical protein BS50DRAFT_280770 [Corynespora cassiicola Philippines]
MVDMMTPKRIHPSAVSLSSARVSEFFHESRGLSRSIQVPIKAPPLILRWMECMCNTVSPPTRLIRKQQHLPSQSLSETSTLPSGPRYPAPNITLKHTSFLPADHARTSDIQECSAWRVRSIFPGPLAPSSHLRGRDKSLHFARFHRLEADFLFRLRLGARLALAKGCRPPMAAGGGTQPPLSIFRERCSCPRQMRRVYVPCVRLFQREWILPGRGRAVGADVVVRQVTSMKEHIIGRKAVLPMELGSPLTFANSASAER